MKKYPDGNFQRLNYRKAAPLESLHTYGDSTLSFLEGDYYAYTGNGNLNCKGYYYKNKKDSTWYFYNDSSKVVRQEFYKDGELLKMIDPDTLTKGISASIALTNMKPKPISRGRMVPG